MIELDSLKDIDRLFDSANTLRVDLENRVQSQSREFSAYCGFCEGVKSMSVLSSSKDWVDLRGQMVCSGCGLSNRDRLLVKALKIMNLPVNTETLIFEKVTTLYDRISSIIPNIRGVEFGGYHLVSGDHFTYQNEDFEHQDMMNLSFENEYFDLVVHSDVLEHIPDPMRAIRECMRVLNSRGVLLFSTPMYSKQFSHITTAKLNQSYEVEFVGEELYHGNPISDNGVPVFTLFGMNLLETIQALGYKCSYLIDHSILEGIYSNNNQYYEIGHMWPIVVKVVKP